MTEPLVPAYLVHMTPGRVRLRIPDRRGNARYFADLERTLASRREFAGVTVNAYTGSVLLSGAEGIEASALAASGRQLGLFDIQERCSKPAKSALVTASVGLHGVDGLFARASGGYLDFKSGVFIALLLLAGRQIYKGNFMVPGFTFLWYALTLMME